MTVEEAIALLQREDPGAELYVLELIQQGNPHYNAWAYVHEKFRRISSVQSRDGLVAFVQEDEAQLANAAR